MLQILYPDHPYKIKQEDNKEWIFDEVRKKWLRLTPEEWVRQNFVQYLIQQKMYPASLIGIEKELLLNDIKKRCDILVFKNGLPFMLVECKEMNVPLSDNVLQQILAYNVAMPVKYLCVTNGTYCYLWLLDNGTVTMLTSFPGWNEL
ncbi:type I restriction enzyme HsdR N-terminal domain-containing protein [Danxiaibacter flavus]|uniref:Type I restriction enzyme HsdR N-terminal domain-containing protein n=1 Tax=Danxiaibacter flavus TaxID=3049108 RepID=A0ABV3ZA57_9BACT|nr:type I restriction enzyme HsdR N-terminal domain-containing protein [Chitinophagaceae bacterium DXS]